MLSYSCRMYQTGALKKSIVDFIQRILLKFSTPVRLHLPEFRHCHDSSAHVHCHAFRYIFNFFTCALSAEMPGKVRPPVI